MKAKRDWSETKQRFEAWWKGSLSESPLMSIKVINEESAETMEETTAVLDVRDRYLNADRILAEYRNYMRTRSFVADSYPNLSLDLGPGSLSLYLGSEPVFAEDTVWYKECVESWRDYPLAYDAGNFWWKTHYGMIKKAVEASQEEFYVNIPDIIENIDIISAMGGPQNTCYDLMDETELIAQRIRELDDVYFEYYDAFYELVKDSEGGSSYTAFNIWGPGRTAKVQCDFCAMMSPGQFRDLIQPSLEKQCSRLDYSMYHLDGPDAIRHLPALMEIGELNALQWTSGAGQPDGGSEKWYPIYDRVRDAGKSLWVSVSDGDSYVLAEKSKKLVSRYGLGGLYILFPDMDRASAEYILKTSRHW